MREQITAEDEHSLGGRGNAVAGHAIAVRLARTYGVFNEESPHFAEFVDKIHRGEIDLAARGRRAALKSGEADASFFADKIGRSILGRLRHNADMLAPTRTSRLRDSECGDGFCEPRDENPSYDPDPYEREGAPSSGRGRGARGRLARRVGGWGRYDADAPDQARGGWNACHATDRSWGTPETVCLFDGDVQINGLPYRTAELDVESSSFGESKVLDLYAGTGSCATPSTASPGPTLYKDLENPSGKAVQIGFPAIRGQICTRHGHERRDAGAAARR
ncbi:hypothetical protein JL720_16154 [Aureococcus anophagefferens]|nr:hypothetical protein JL720_16154 [Aureococcus anophagefferens]